MTTEELQASLAYYKQRAKEASDLPTRYEYQEAARKTQAELLRRAFTKGANDE